MVRLELDLVGDDVALGAAVDGADGDDGGVEWVFFAADDGLELRDEERGEDDGVAAEVGLRAVAADALDDDVDGGGAGHCAGPDLTPTVPAGWMAVSCRPMMMSGRPNRS